MCTTTGQHHTADAAQARKWCEVSREAVTCSAVLYIWFCIRSNAGLHTGTGPPLTQYRHIHGVEYSGKQ